MLGSIETRQSHPSGDVNLIFTSAIWGFLPLVVVGVNGGGSPFMFMVVWGFGGFISCIFGCYLLRGRWSRNQWKDDINDRIAKSLWLRRRIDRVRKQYEGKEGVDEKRKAAIEYEKKRTLGFSNIRKLFILIFDSLHKGLIDVSRRGLIDLATPQIRSEDEDSMLSQGTYSPRISKLKFRSYFYGVSVLFLRPLTIVFFVWSTDFLSIIASGVLYESLPILFLLTFLLIQNSSRKSYPVSRAILLFPLIIGGSFLVWYSTWPEHGLQIAGISLLMLASILIYAENISFMWSSYASHAEQEYKRYSYEGKSDIDIVDSSIFYFMCFRALSSLFGSMAAGLVVFFHDTQGIGSFKGSSFFIIFTCGFLIEGLGSWQNAVGVFRSIKTPTVQAVRYLTPLFGAGYLWLTYLGGSSAIYNIHLEMLFYGVFSIVGGGMLYRYRAEKRFGIASFAVAIWLVGGFILLRDRIYELSFLKHIRNNFYLDIEAYFALIALASAAFTLLVAFRANRISTRTNEEEGNLFTLLANFSELEDKDSYSLDKIINSKDSSKMLIRKLSRVSFSMNRLDPEAKEKIKSIEEAEAAITELSKNKKLYRRILKLHSKLVEVEIDNKYDYDLLRNWERDSNIKGHILRFFQGKKAKTSMDILSENTSNLMYMNIYSDLLDRDEYSFKDLNRALMRSIMTTQRVNRTIGKTMPLLNSLLNKLATIEYDLELSLVCSKDDDTASGRYLQVCNRVYWLILVDRFNRCPAIEDLWDSVWDMKYSLADKNGQFQELANRELLEATLEVLSHEIYSKERSLYDKRRAIEDNFNESDSIIIEIINELTELGKHQAIQNLQDKWRVVQTGFNQIIEDIDWITSEEPIDELQKSFDGIMAELGSLSDDEHIQGITRIGESLKISHDQVIGALDQLLPSFDSGNLWGIKETHQASIDIPLAKLAISCIMVRGIERLSDSKTISEIDEQIVNNSQKIGEATITINRLLKDSVEILDLLNKIEIADQNHIYELVVIIDDMEREFGYSLLSSQNFSKHIINMRIDKQTNALDISDLKYSDKLKSIRYAKTGLSTLPNGRQRLILFLLATIEEVDEYDSLLRNLEIIDSPVKPEKLKKSYDRIRTRIESLLKKVDKEKEDIAELSREKN